MPEVLFIRYPNWHKEVKYASDDALGHTLIDYYTIRQLTEEQLDEIKTATLDRVQLILNRYI